LIQRFRTYCKRQATTALACRTLSPPALSDGRMKSASPSLDTPWRRQPGYSFTAMGEEGWERRVRPRLEWNYAEIGAISNWSKRLPTSVWGIGRTSEWRYAPGLCAPGT